MQRQLAGVEVPSVQELQQKALQQAAWLPTTYKEASYAAMPVSTYAGQRRLPPGQCYGCGQVGHFIKDCPHSKGRDRYAGPPPTGRSRTDMLDLPQLADHARLLLVGV